MRKIAAICALVSIISIAAFQSSPLTPSQMDMLKPLIRVGGASGVVIKSYKASDGNFYAHIITCAHVVEKFKTLKTNVPIIALEFDAKGKIVSNTKYEGWIEEYEEDCDYAIIACKIDYILPVCKVGPIESRQLKIFDRVVAVGCPLSEPIWATEGIVSSLNTRFKYPNSFGHSAQIAPGNSGGPLYKDGYLVGINCAMSTFKGKIVNQESETIGSITTPVYHIAISISLVRIMSVLGPKKVRTYFGN